MAFDYGARRIGVAVGQTTTASGSPAGVIDVRATPDWTALGRCVREWSPSRLLVGLPYNMDGSDTLLTATCRAFAAELERRFGLLQATALNMSNMIGVGPFITIPLLMSALGGPQALLGWLVALVIVMADGLVWSELSAAMPGSFSRPAAFAPPASVVGGCCNGSNRRPAAWACLSVSAA